MRNYSLNPTEENAYKLLRENPIQRNEYVFQFVRLLTHMEDNCYSVALNGDWGSGKATKTASCSSPSSRSRE